MDNQKTHQRKVNIINKLIQRLVNKQLNEPIQYIFGPYTNDVDTNIFRIMCVGVKGNGIMGFSIICFYNGNERVIDNKIRFLIKNYLNDPVGVKSFTSYYGMENMLESMQNGYFSNTEFTFPTAITPFKITTDGYGFQRIES